MLLLPTQSIKIYLDYLNISNLSRIDSSTVFRWPSNTDNAQRVSLSKICVGLCHYSPYAAMVDRYHSEFARSRQGFDKLETTISNLGPRLRRSLAIAALANPVNSYHTNFLGDAI
jgi:hypothetical protein